MSETASPAPSASPAPVTPTPAPVTPTPAPATPAPAETSPPPATTPGSNATTPSGEAKPAGNFKEQFKAFSKFGDTKSDGKLITLSQSDKWMKQAGVIDKKLTTTDTGIYFKKFKSLKIGIADYDKFMEDLAKSKKLEVADLKSKMASCGAPGLHGTGHVKVAGAVDRLTDVSRYTGSHKQRFDETGKGKGIAGRKDVAETSGYVQGYQNKDSYLHDT